MYTWRVVEDPTRGPDHYGDFYNRLFRWLDIKMGLGECGLPSGTVLENVNTGKQLKVYRGALLSVRKSGQVLMTPGQER